MKLNLSEAERIRQLDPAIETTATGLVFGHPELPEGTIEIDLAGKSLDDFNHLRFDLRLDEAPTDIIATLRGYPALDQGRRWYVFKRFQPLDEWTDIRLDLNLDDDLSRTRFEEEDLSLTLQFTRPAGEPAARAEIRNLQFVRNPVTVTVDYRTASRLEGGGTLYPVKLANLGEDEKTVRLEIDSRHLNRFGASMEVDEVILGPGETATVEVIMALIPGGEELPLGYAERAELRIFIEGHPGWDLVPTRGYRPTYLFGLVPPPAESVEVFMNDLRSAAERLRRWNEERRTAVLEWPLEQPPEGVLPARIDGLRCPECRSQMDVDSLYVYFCHSRDISGQCPNHQVRFEVDRDHRFFRNMLATYNRKSAALARDAALLWITTGEARYAEKALEILEAYEEWYPAMDIVSEASTGFQSRLKPVTLFERHVLGDFVEAYLVLRETEAVDAARLTPIASGFLNDMLYRVNLHYYGTSASQVDMVTQAMKAAVILGNDPILADSLSGDGGVQRILDRNFNADGVGVDGGDYARQAARQIMRLAEFLDGIGLTVDRERLEMIERNSRLMGYLPRPDDFEWETLYLPNTGFTFLVNGQGDTRRRATINWGSTRERYAHDLLTTVFYGADDAELIQRTLRINWGLPESFYSYQSVSQNIPIVDQGNISRLPKEQVFLFDDGTAAGVLTRDYAARPAYPDARLVRALVLSEGCLLIVDRILSDSGERQFDLPIFGLSTISDLSTNVEPTSKVMGETRAYQLPADLRHGAIPNGRLRVDWEQGNRGTRLHFLGDVSEVFTGRTPSGWRGENRAFMMVRGHGETAVFASLYEATAGEHPKVKSFTRLPVEDASGNRVDEARGLAYEVTFDNGRRLQVLLSLDESSVRLGDLEADEDTPIRTRILNR